MDLLNAQEGVSIQELPVSSAPAAPTEVKHAPSKPVKQEDSKGESTGGGVSSIPADALNRLIAMGGPAGKLLPVMAANHSASPA